MVRPRTLSDRQQLFIIGLIRLGLRLDQLKLITNQFSISCSRAALGRFIQDQRPGKLPRRSRQEIESGKGTYNDAPAWVLFQPGAMPLAFQLEPAENPLPRMAQYLETVLLQDHLKKTGRYTKKMKPRFVHFQESIDRWACGVDRNRYGILHPHAQMLANMNRGYGLSHVRFFLDSMEAMLMTYRDPQAKKYLLDEIVRAIRYFFQDRLNHFLQTAGLFQAGQVKTRVCQCLSALPDGRAEQLAPMQTIKDLLRISFTDHGQDIFIGLIHNIVEKTYRTRRKDNSEGRSYSWTCPEELVHSSCLPARMTHQPGLHCIFTSQPVYRGD